MSVSPSSPLPVHGFVLAGGKSSRMGRDKATLPYCGRPMIEIAVARLKEFCSLVSVAGNREDLREIAPVVPERHLDAGPAAGILAALSASSEPWTLVTPVDVPLVPGALLRAWGEAVLGSERAGVRLSFLRANGVRQPAFCMLHAECLAGVARLFEGGERKLGVLFEKLAEDLGTHALWIAEAEALASRAGLGRSDFGVVFGNVNTPEDLAALEVWGCSGAQAAG